MFALNSIVSFVVVFLVIVNKQVESKYVLPIEEDPTQMQMCQQRCVNKVRIVFLNI